MNDDLQNLARRLAPLLRPWLFVSHRARIYNSGNVSIGTGGSPTNVTWNNNRYDPSGISTANGFTIATAGVYRIGANIRWAANATGQRVLYLQVNSSTYIAIASQQAVTGGNPTDMSIVTEYALSAGDTVRLQAFQDSGGALNITAAGNYSPEFWISIL
jgi:hypothetical protein